MHGLQFLILVHHLRRTRTGRFDTRTRDNTPFLHRLEVLPQLGHHALQPLQIIPTFLPLLDFSAILDVARAVGVLERVHRLSGVPFGGGDTGDHDGVGVSA